MEQVPGNRRVAQYTLQTYLNDTQLGYVDKVDYLLGAMIDAVTRSPKDLTRSETNAALKKFVLLSKIDTLSGVRFPDAPDFNITYTFADKTVHDGSTPIEGGSTDFTLIKKLIPNQEQLFKIIFLESKNVKSDFLNFINLHVFDNWYKSAPDTGRLLQRSEKYLDFLGRADASRSFRAINVRSMSIFTDAGLPALPTVEKLLDFYNDVKTFDITQYFDALFKALNYTAKDTYTKDEFKADMSEIYSGLGWGIWNNSLNITKTTDGKGGFKWNVTTKDFEKFKIIFLTENALEEMVEVLTQSYGNLSGGKFDIKTFSINLATELYKSQIDFNNVALKVVPQLAIVERTDLGVGRSL